MKRILVIPSGTELGLEIHESLCRRRDVLLVGAESTTNSHAAFVFRRNHPLPYCEEENFITSLTRLVNQERIDFIYPAHDSVQLTLAGKGTPVGCPVISSPPQTLAITCFKSKTYELLQDALPVPQRFDPHELRDEAFPVFVKPDRGQGSQNAHVCRRRAELDLALASPESGNQLVCEYLPGREVTVDCFSDREQGLLLADARLRARIRAGISVRSVSVDLPIARQLALQISARLRLFGAWFFQLKERKEDEWVLLEVGARIPGGAAYQRLRGINLPLLTLLEHLRLPIRIAPYGVAVVMDKAFASRFTFPLDIGSLYVDFDDTLSMGGDLNAELVALIAYARHRGKHVELLSRNRTHCRAWLEARGLAGLFTRISLIERDESKAALMRADGVLVDDSFTEREACAREGRICVDTDAATALLDHLRRG